MPPKSTSKLPQKVRPDEAVSPHSEHSNSDETEGSTDADVEKIPKSLDALHEHALFPIFERQEPEDRYALSRCCSRLFQVEKTAPGRKVVLKYSHISIRVSVEQADGDDGTRRATRATRSAAHALPTATYVEAFTRNDVQCSVHAHSARSRCELAEEDPHRRKDKKNRGTLYKMALGTAADEISVLLESTKVDSICVEIDIDEVAHREILYRILAEASSPSLAVTHGKPKTQLERGELKKSGGPQPILDFGLFTRPLAPALKTFIISGICFDGARSQEMLTAIKASSLTTFMWRQPTLPLAKNCFDAFLMAVIGKDFAHAQGWPYGNAYDDWVIRVLKIAQLEKAVVFELNK